MNKTSISLKYLNGLYIAPSNLVWGPFPAKVEVMSLTAEMMRLGYIPTEKLLKSFSNMSQLDFFTLYPEIINSLKESVGDHVVHKPMYPNFPKQVMDASHCELFINAIVHYATQGQWLPDYDKLPREFAFDSTKFKEIDLVTLEEFNTIIDRLLSANESLSQTDKDTVHWFLDIRGYIPVNINIPFKENMCLLAANTLITDCNAKKFDAFIRTATDVLRVVTHMNAGDISLATNTRFRSMPRRQRRIICRTLERVITEEDIHRHKNKWIRLFHSLHVGDYGGELARIANKFRNNEKVKTFNGSVRQAIDSKYFNLAVALLEKRPGEFARKLDEIVRKSDISNAITAIEQFGRVTPEINTRLLLQLWGHFNGRTNLIEDRLVFPKGTTQKAYLIKKRVPPLEVGVPEKITETIYDTLQNRFAELPKIEGKVWLDPALYGCPIPTQQRSASDGLFQAARGTRIPMSDSAVIRFFLYWVGRDIDLSATFHDKDFTQVGQTSYTHIKNDEFCSYHSGDITRAPKGASEFIDVDIAKAAKKAKYMVMNVYVFAGEGFDAHSTCFVGWMGRNKLNSNEIYDPKTVEQKIDLKGSSKNSIPVIFDLEKRQIIWTDLYTTRQMYFGGNNVHSNKPTTQRMLQGMITLDSKVSLYELLATHASARSDGIVETKEEADVVFGFEGDVTPYDITTINSEYVV